VCVGSGPLRWLCESCEGTGVSLKVKALHHYTASQLLAGGPTCVTQLRAHGTAAARPHCATMPIRVRGRSPRRRYLAQLIHPMGAAKPSRQVGRSARPHRRPLAAGYCRPNAKSMLEGCVLWREPGRYSPLRIWAGTSRTQSYRVGRPLVECAIDLAGTSVPSGKISGVARNPSSSSPGTLRGRRRMS
jgi:hypothetical protein